MAGGTEDLGVQPVGVKEDPVWGVLGREASRCLPRAVTEHLGGWMGVLC